QWQVGASLTDLHQVFVGGGIDDRYLYAVVPYLPDTLAYGFCTRLHTKMVDESHPVSCLSLQYPDQVRVGHGCEWMVAHAAFFEQCVAYEQISFENGSAVFRKCGAGYGKGGVQRFHERIGYRPYVALVGR